MGGSKRKVDSLRQGEGCPEQILLWNDQLTAKLERRLATARVLWWRDMQDSLTVHIPSFASRPKVNPAIDHNHFKEMRPNAHARKTQRHKLLLHSSATNSM